MRKISAPLLLGVFLLFIFAKPVLAHCPLCAAGAGAGLTLSRWLGVDDSITGIWLAAFLAAISLWFSGSLKKKYIPFQNFIIYVAIFGLTLWGFYAFGLINTHAGIIMGYPKLTVGMVLGSVVFYILEEANQYIIKRKGRILFPYQRLVVGLGGMFVLSILMYVFVNYYI